MAGPPGVAQTRHLPLVPGAADSMSSACQAAPTSVVRLLPTAAFYLKLGFRLTGEVVHGQTVAVLDL